MSIAPPPMPGDLERLTWGVIPKELQGKVVSLEELKTIFPQKENESEILPINKDTSYTVYGKTKNIGLIKFHVKLAYECASCHKIQIGPPVIEDDISFRDGMPLAGREGYDVYCQNCKAHLDEETFANS